MLFATNVVAAEGPEPLAVVHQFIDSFDKGDVKGAEATHAADVTIIDEVPPYHWQGRGAFKSWVADLTTYDKANGVTDGHVELGNPLRQEVSGARAYIVMSSEYSFKQKGATMREPSQMTFALKKDRHGWRIVGWAFTGPKPTP
ncbi:MAG TPA: nuclear transport factor 2 family protein [Candidatus Binatia bacterium]